MIKIIKSLLWSIKEFVESILFILIPSLLKLDDLIVDRKPIPFEIVITISPKAVTQKVTELDAVAAITKVTTFFIIEAETLCFFFNSFSIDEFHFWRSWSILWEY